MSSGALPGGWLSIASPQDPQCGTRGSSTEGKVIVVDKGDTLAQASLGAHHISKLLAGIVRCHLNTSLLNIP